MWPWPRGRRSRRSARRRRRGVDSVAEGDDGVLPARREADERSRSIASVRSRTALSTGVFAPRYSTRQPSARSATASIRRPRSCCSPGAQARTAVPRTPPRGSAISCSSFARTRDETACSCAIERRPGVPLLADPAAATGVTTSWSATSSGSTANAWSRSGPTCERVVRRGGHERVAQRLRLGERWSARLVEQARGLADPPPLGQPVAQPFHACDVLLAVAPLSALGALRPEDAVARLPLAERVGCDPGAPRDRSDVEQRRHEPGRILDFVAARRVLPMPEGDSLHRIALRLQPLVGERVEASSPHPRGRATGVAEASTGGCSAGGRGRQAPDPGLRRRPDATQPPADVRPLAPSASGRRAWRPPLARAPHATRRRGPVERADARRRPGCSAIGPDLLAPERRPRGDRAAAAGGCAAHPARGGAPGSGARGRDREPVGRGGALARAALAVAPRREAGEGELESLLAWARREMLAAVRDRRPERAVYRRAGRPCPRCGAAIRSRGIGDDNRTAYWCPTCQPDPAPSR